MEEGVTDKCGDSEVKSRTGRTKTELFLGLQRTSRECLSVGKTKAGISTEALPRFYLHLGRKSEKKRLGFESSKRTLKSVCFPCFLRGYL